MYIHLYESLFEAEDEKSLTYLGKVSESQILCLEQLLIINTNDFNKILFIEDQYIEESNVKLILALAISKYNKAKATPGYKNQEVEKFIELFQIAANNEVGIQVFCD